MTWGVAKTKTMYPCHWIYCSAACGVSNEVIKQFGWCDHTFEACRIRKNEHHFSGYFVDTEEKAMSEKFWIVLPKTFEVVTLLDNGMRHIRNDIPSSLIRYNTRPDAIAAAKK
jgi:hypothetical protein